MLEERISYLQSDSFWSHISPSLCCRGKDITDAAPQIQKWGYLFEFSQTASAVIVIWISLMRLVVCYAITSQSFYNTLYENISLPEGEESTGNRLL